ncbi:MAG TPA: DUF1553 domain-containing protein [Bryobacteraceae bacterium]|nr:DUF1553 domain-containing protein [Bryobacteraceae bacterium]
MMKSIAVSGLLIWAGGMWAATPGITRLSVYPERSSLRGSKARQALLITADYGNGEQRDVTRRTAFRVVPNGTAAVSESGIVSPLREGKARVEATFEGRTAVAELTVTDLSTNHAVSFKRDIAPILTEKGCTGSNCHGSVRGKADFKLSLFGGRPDLDYEAVVKAGNGRRINAREPEKSLILRKPSFLEPHGGGVRFKPGSVEYKTILEWIANGCVYDGGGPELQDISVYPPERILVGAGAKFRLIVTGRYSDGTEADLSGHVRYTSNDETLATVDDDGEVTTKRPGETSIMIRSQGKTAVATIATIAKLAGPDYPRTPTNHLIDTLVFAKLRKLNIVPSELSSDTVFVRRIYLDTLGTLPTAEETRRFLGSTEPDKRARLVEELLARPEFVDLWSLKFADLFQLGGAGVKGGWQFYRWIRQSLADNKPYDRMVREMLMGSGSFVFDPTVNYYKGLWTGPEGMVTQVSQSLLGIRMDCAKCHDHPFERWTQDDFYGFAGFFTRLQYKAESYGLFERSIAVRPTNQPTYDYVSNNKLLVYPKSKAVVTPRYLGGDAVEAKPGEDIRERLADWVVSPRNPWFSRAITNRIWKHFLGRGIVEPVDDFRVSNPPSNPELLDALAAEFVRDKFDLRSFVRTILNSRTYQLSSTPNGSNEADNINYSRFYLKRQMAEVLYDAMGQAAGKRLKIPGYPPGERALHVAVGSPNYFMMTFGKVQFRDQICERDQQADVAQAMHLVNGDTVNGLVSAAGNIVDSMLKQAEWPDRRRVEEIYLTALSRPPTAAEWAAFNSRLAGADEASKKQAYQDLLWAILNSNEFGYIY